MSDSLFTTTPAPAGSHPSVDTWIAYYAREVPEVEAESLREHLSRCRSCVDLVLDLDRFVEPAAAGGGVSDFEQAAVWRSVKQAIEPRTRLQGWPTVAAVAASLVFAVVGLAQYDVRTDLESRLAESSRLQPNMVIRDLRPGARERNSGGVDATVDLPAGAGTVALILNLKDDVDFPAYEIRVLDAAGEEIAEVSGLAINELGNFSLALPPGALAAGSYELQLFGLADGREKLLEVYPIRLQ